MFYIGIYRENMKKSYCLKSYGLELRYLVCSITLWTSTKFVQIMPRGQIWPRGHMFYTGLYREKHEKIFLSKTTRPSALIFNMKHHLVNLYQVCSNFIPGTKNGPDPESH